MKNRIVKLCQIAAAWQSVISQRIDLFWEKEDELYRKNKIAYAHRGFLFFSSISVIFTLVLLIAVYFTYGEV